MRIALDAGTPFAELAARTAAAHEEAAAHRVSVSALVAALEPEPTRGGGWFCNTGFGVAGSDAWDGGPLDLVLHVGAGEVRATYRTDLFEAATVDRLLGHYATLLADALARPGAAVGDLALLGDEERHRLLVEWNDTGHDVPAATWPEMFAAQVAARPDEVALVFEETRLTYAELDAHANRLAHALVARGAGPERVVALAVPRSAELIVAEVAVLKSGAAYLPVDTDYPADRIAYMLSDAGPVCLVTTSEVAADLPTATDTAPLVLDDPAVAAELAALPAHALTCGARCPSATPRMSSTPPVPRAAPRASCCPRGRGQARRHPARALRHRPAQPGPAVCLAQLRRGLLGPVPRSALRRRLVVVPAERRVPGAPLADYANAHGITFMILPPALLAAMPEDVQLPRRRPCWRARNVSRPSWSGGTRAAA